LLEQPVIPYLEYHKRSMEIGDVDPSYAMLRYVCDRFELNLEQRYWLAFLDATCYCGPTVFYMYNEFPDFENVNVGRLQRWWDANKSRLVFQTDRRWIRSNDQFVDMYCSYRDLMYGMRQAEFFANLIPGILDDELRKKTTYDAAYLACSHIKYMGRFSLFLYLEAVHVVTGLPMRPHNMKILEAEACRRGLEKAYLTDFGAELSRAQMQKAFELLVQKMIAIDSRNTVWNIETTLCAYGKYHLGKRYIGYYLNRQGEEIAKTEKLVPDGVDWRVLWQYRKETYGAKHLTECNLS
jgi:hypothetical protein